MAIACKTSFELGFDGFVQFTAKTNLIDHYRGTLGAQLIGGQTMIVDTDAAIPNGLAVPSLKKKWSDSITQWSSLHKKENRTVFAAR